MNRCRRIVDQFLYRACVDRRLAMLGTPLGPRSLVTLFAGAGGADVGLKDTGWHGKLMVERDPPAAATLVAAREQGFIDGEVIRGRCELGGLHPLARRRDCCGAASPCQGFSPSGKGKGIEDERDGWPGTVRAIDQLQPRWFIGENSANLARAHRCTLTNVLLADLRKRFAYADYRVLSAADYGVPQMRKRVIIVAGPKPIRWPEPTHVEVTEEMLIQARKEMGYSGAGGMGRGGSGWMGSGGLVEDDLRKVGKERHNTILDALAPDWDRYSDDIEDDPRWEYLPTIAGIWEDEDEYVERQVSEGVDREEAEREFNDSSTTTSRSAGSAE